MSEPESAAYPMVSNRLLDMISGAEPQRLADNALLIQQHQQQIGAADVEMVARAGQGLLGMSPEAAAAAYPGVIAGLRAQGYAKHAPDAYPGHDVTRQLVSLGIPADKQWERQQDIAAAKDMYTPPTTTGAAPAVPGGGGGGQPSLAIPARGTGGPGASASMPPEYLQHFREASAETGIPMDVLIAQARQESSFNPNARGGAGEIGLFQIKPSTAQQPGFGMAGVDPATLSDPRSNILFGARYLKARGGAGDPNNPAWQASALAAYNGGGDPNYVANVNRYRPGMSPTDPAASVTAYTPGGAQPTAPGTTTAAAAPPVQRVAVGDSLAVGIGGAGKLPTFANTGDSPQVILQKIKAMPADAVAGKDVVLSGGASNATAPSDVALVAQQVQELKAKGAKSVTVVGVGNRPDFVANGVNTSLQNIATQTGAEFQPVDPATLTPGGVHPTGAGYAALAAPPAPRGAAARTGGVDVAGPGAGSTAATGGAPGAAPAQAPAAVPTGPPPTPPEPRQNNGYTVRQNQVLMTYQRQGNLKALGDAQQKFDDDNRQSATTYATQVRQYQQDQRQAAADVETRAQHAQTLANQAQQMQISQKHLDLAVDANQRANQELEEKAKAAGDTFVPGTGIEAVHENTVQKYAAKIARGQQLTDDEQRLYDGAYYALQQTGGQTGVMTDPNNPGQQVPFQTTRRLSPSLPEPKGGALPAVISQPGAAKKEAVSTEQSKAAGFADRVQLALPIITDTSPAAMNRWQQMLGKVPLVGNTLVTPEFQMHMQAERDFINAVLRRESGMAIGADEFANARLQYIPQPGDSPQVLAQKKQNRETQLAGIIRDAGPNYKPTKAETTSTTTQGSTTPPSRVVQLDANGKIIK